MVLTTYGRSSGFCVDPIEKKPLNHFYPGSRVFSFGTAGCNLGCKFCQNWDMSKSRDMDILSRKATPDDIAQSAKKNDCQSVAFTYNDPVIFAEYAVDTAHACHGIGIKTVAVTAGYISEKARSYFFSAMDGANVDLKSIRPAFYKKMALGKLEPVLETLVFLRHETDVWFEITNLIIPGHNDSEADLRDLAQWIMEELGPHVPVHFTAFHPDYKLSGVPRTPDSTLLSARTFALEAGIKYVYLGNCRLPNIGDTNCHHCGNLLIQRQGYHISQYQLTIEGTCPSCGVRVPGKFHHILEGDCYK